MRTRPALLALFIAISLLLAACGDDTTADRDPDPIVPGDTGTDDDGSEPGADDEFPTDSVREDARGVLGMYESDLPEEVRVRRRGDEQFMLTEDYVLGRLTVDLDDDGDGYRVMSVTVELPDGPETFDLEPG